ncbi:TonB-dependent receptor [Fluviicola sp.]|uniref:TonB-dependent receptor n=1 Tax=Fluviicola sp. TaxID=1917219 RepID=UPI0031DA4139
MSFFRYFLPIWIVFLIFPAFSQEFSGTVKNETGDPVQARIRVLNTETETRSNADGMFVISGLLPGEYLLHISSPTTGSLEYPIRFPDTVQHEIILKDKSVTLETVTVSAVKQETLQRDFPGSVTILSARDVTRLRLWNTTDFTALAPNLFTGNPGDNRTVTSIRGITSTSYDPAVATYIDGVNQFGLDTYISELIDVERIEFLRGPQGTLYGRGAMGGVISIITKEPSNKTRGFAEAHLGNYGWQRYSAGISTPVVKNKLYAGVSAVYQSHNGFFTNEYNHSSFDVQQTITANYNLKYQLGKHWSLRANFKQNHHRNNGAFPLHSSKEEAMEQPYRLNQDAVAKMIDNTLNGSLSFHYSGKQFHFVSQSTFQTNQRYYDGAIDGDFSPLDAVSIYNDYGGKWNRTTVPAQEFRFSSPATAKRLKWVAGSYLFFQEGFVKQAVKYGGDALLIGAPDTDFSVINTSKFRSAGGALFGQVTWVLIEKLELTAGLRYDLEYKRQSVLSEYQKDPDPEPLFALRSDTTGKADFTAFSPKAGLLYHINETSSGYATYSRGFRPGGLTQLSNDPSQPPLYAFDPEYSDNLEVGFRSSLLKNQLSFHVALFYTMVLNAQVPTLILPEAITITRNAGKLISKGVELELAALPFKQVEIRGNFGYTDARYPSLTLSQNDQAVELDNHRQLFTPRVTSLLVLQYTQPLKHAFVATLRGEWKYVGDHFFDLANQISQEAYNLLNVRAGIGYRQFESAIWVRNLADTRFIDYAYDFGAVHLGAPRTYGLSLIFHFD